MHQGDDDVHVVGPATAAVQLDALLDRARTGGPVVALVEGPAGIGRTTVLRRFLHRHADLQVTAAAGLPWESSRNGALARRLLDDDPRHLPAPPDAADAVDLGTALAGRWESRAGEGPLVVVVDDAHCADPVSLQAITSGLARLRDVAVLVLLARATGWPAAGEPRAVEVLDRLPAVPVPVPPLGPAETRLLAARIAAVDLPLSVARRLCTHTAGIPRHLLELLNETPPARWSDWQTRLPVPSRVQQRVRRTLDGCPRPARALVEAAAVLGPTPVLADAAALAEVSDPIGALDEACAAGLLEATAGHGLDTLAFPERFVRDAVHATLTPAARHRLHLRAATLVTDDTDRLRHRVEAAPLPDAGLAEELVELARRKADEGAWAVVAGALIDAGRISPSRAAREERLLEAVDALAGAGLLGQAVDALPEVEALPSGPRRDAVLAYVAVQRGRRAEAVSYLDTAWRHRGSDRRAAAVVCQRHVLHALADWDGDELVRWAGRAGEYAEPGAPAAVESRAIVGLGLAACGAVDAAFTAYRQAVAESPSGPQHQRSRMGLGWLSLAQDEPEAARRELESAVPTVRQTGSKRISLWALVWLARTRFVLGDWPGALDAVNQAEVLLGTTGLDLLRPLVHWTGAQVRALRGEQEAAERHLLLGAAAEHDYTVRTVPALLARASVAEAASDYDAVVRHLTPLVLRTPRGGLDEPGFWPWHDVYANALVVTGRLPEAEAFLAPHEATVRRRGHRSAGARLGYVRGRLLAARGDLLGAEEAFDQARAQLAGLPMPYERARVDFAHGVTLRRVGRRRDAAALLTTARQSFAALGAQVYVERCDRELKTGRPAPRAAEPGTENLTEQERTVATLVATGLTNKEVAASMLLSVKTVQFHLTRIYAKLGVRSRSELAARFAPARGQR
ncbi:LuxR C-terminal-related transcriptional regulator [Geodermatophilus obscurus]|uniref:Transcriptional regulator, LuxR family n=1 Tax=Geodermatophilus obscurus (strain ATCC 25078 / DSM 43160 / JCM 3152 / CCUG 61914 / KCC A-0152 / KCTC 9177 / NBRC 13315 / NRRL B-3577 / G-20) TaxID=526225 RepID=D2SB90_GEOOG|nr:LuxR family transcriptional regulator [Geodermatophilus obscurus]ADB74038.1 transcriptional regulator, LuxR family [Geodermatophilus obscurus DSM 43160]